MSSVALRAAGTALVLDVDGPALPRVVHWGADVPGLEDEPGLLDLLRPPVPHNAPDEPWPLPLLPTEADGWSGHPGIAWHRSGGSAAPRLRLVGPVAVEHDPDGGGTLVATASDAEAGAEVEVRLALDPHGVVRTRVTVRSTAAEGLLDLAAVRVLLPLPASADEVLDLTGRWVRERAPAAPSAAAGHAPARLAPRPHRARRHRSCCAAGRRGFGFRHGEVRATHVAWSGDHEHLAERLPEGAGGHAGVLGGGELLRAGEIRLGPGEEYVVARGGPRLVRCGAGRASPTGCTARCGPAPATRRRRAPWS